MALVRAGSWAVRASGATTSASSSGSTPGRARRRPLALRGGTRPPALLPRPGACRPTATAPQPASLEPVAHPSPPPSRSTLHSPDGQKKAYVRLTQDYDALDVANRIGII